MPTYRYRRAGGLEPVEIVAASYERTKSGVARFHDVTAADGEWMLRAVDVRHVLISGDVETVPVTRSESPDSSARGRDDLHHVPVHGDALPLDERPVRAPRGLRARIHAHEIEMHLQAFPRSETPPT